MAKCKILIISLLLSFNSIAVETVAEYGNEVFDVYRSLTFLIRPSLSEEQKVIMGKINFSVTDAGLNAFAYKNYRDNHRFNIKVSLPLIYLNEQFSYGMAYVAITSDIDCLNNYMQKQIDLANRYSRGSLEGVEDTRNTAFVLYAKSHKNKCKYFDMDLIDDNGFIDYSLSYRNLSTYWILLHEIAHHVLGHTENIKSGCDVNIKRKERDADFWAIDMMDKVNMPFYTADSFHTYFIFIDSIDGLETEASCHYSNIKRLIDMLKRNLKSQKRTQCNGASKSDCRKIINIIEGKIENFKAISKMI